MDVEAESEDGAAIRALGHLFRVTEVFLWDDGYGNISKNSARHDILNKEITSGHRNSSVSHSFSGLKWTDDYSEDSDLAKEMNAMGLPLSFKTNKEWMRKEGMRGGNRRIPPKSSLVEVPLGKNPNTHFCPAEGSSMIERTAEENLDSDDRQVSSLEDVSGLCSGRESKDMSADFCSSKYENSRFYVNGEEWGVFWDDFYARNYYYNFLTQESTWFLPPEHENSALSCPSSDKEHYDLVKEETCLHISQQEEQINEKLSGHKETVLEGDDGSGSSVPDLILPSSAASMNILDHVGQITLSERRVSSEDSFDAADQVERPGSLSGGICFQEGTSISQTKEMTLVSNGMDNHECVMKDQKKYKVKRIRSNQKRLAEENKGQSSSWESEGLSSRIAKYWCQRYSLFSKFDCGVKMDEEGWFSVTPEAIAQHHASRCGSGLVIDGFSGVGGNAIQFAMKAGHVLAIDIDPKKVEYAQHNAAIYGVRDNIDFILGDFFLVSSCLKADVLFISPPWGGPEYAKVPTYDIHSMLKPYAGRFLFMAAAKVAPKVVIFLPRNVDANQLAELSLLYDPPWELEVEKNFLNGKLKGVTAYFSRPSGGRTPDTTSESNS